MSASLVGSEMCIRDSKVASKRKWLTESQVLLQEGYSKANPCPKALKAAKKVMAACAARKGYTRECKTREVMLYKVVVSDESESEFETENSKRVEGGREISCLLYTSDAADDM
eukprot:10235670-Alexandrium_andersonii.AAC.1